MAEILVQKWQHFKKGKTLKSVDIHHTLSDKKELNDLAKKISKEEGISTKEIYFVYSEKS